MIERMRYASLTVVHLSTPRDQRLIRDAFGMLCPAGMPENFLGVMFNSQIFPGMAPPDRHLLTVILGGAQAGDSVPNENAIRAAVPRLLSELLDIGDVKILRTTQWARAIPQLVVGHHRVVEALDALERHFPGLVFAGVDRGGVGVSDRIRIACEAVKRSTERLASESDTKQAAWRSEGEGLRS
jgi:oxygen-dependent protoporphyrinogen oxidase